MSAVIPQERSAYHWQREFGFLNRMWDITDGGCALGRGALWCIHCDWWINLWYMH